LFTKLPSHDHDEPQVKGREGDPDTNIEVEAADEGIIQTEGVHVYDCGLLSGGFSSELRLPNFAQSMLLQDDWLTLEDWTVIISSYEQCDPANTHQSIVSAVGRSSTIPSPLIDTHHLTIHGMATIAAMITNASILAVPCSRGLVVEIHIIPSESLPLSLAPTPAQATIPHYPYIDLLPIPALRDKLVAANAIIDVKEMWRDLSAGNVRVWGACPWEEFGWEIEERFAVKWWFLMDEKVLRSTNFWRVNRGESCLNLEKINARF